METPSIDEPIFREFPKTPRLFRDVVVTEKIDGTNAQIYIVELPDEEVMPTHTPLVAVHGKHLIYAGSRNRSITPDADNYGFARWVRDHADELVTLGVGRHFGEWWGNGIQRNYGLSERRFSLFNTARWADGAKETIRPACCHVVPILYCGPFSEFAVHSVKDSLGLHGSVAAPGFGKPEGIVIYHTAANKTFKVLLENDETPKTLTRQAE